MPGGNRLPVRELAELALLTALIAGGKEAMNALPNIHPVALLLLLAVLRHGWRALYTAFGFALIEISLYGASSLAYLYLWPLLVAAAVPFRTNRSPLFCYWVSGIPFDLVHGVSNGVLVYALLLPLYRLMERYFT